MCKGHTNKSQLNSLHDCYGQHRRPAFETYLPWHLGMRGTCNEEVSIALAAFTDSRYGLVWRAGDPSQSWWRGSTSVDLRLNALALLLVNAHLSATTSKGSEEAACGTL